MAEARTVPHLAPLDALRAVAVALVFVQHLGDRFLPAFELAARPLGRWLGAVVLACVHHAHVGVDLFFVLSGFSLAWAAAHRGAIEPAIPFWKRRIRRIFPGYFVATLVVVLLHPLRLRLRETWIALAGYAAVLQGYVELPAGFIGASWSLTTELHAYLLFPALLRALRPRALRGVALLPLVGLPWLLRATFLVAFERFGGRTWWLLELTQHRLVFARLDQFALGAAAALLVAERGAFARIAAAVGAYVGPALVVGGALLEEPGWGAVLPYALGYPLVSLGMTLVVASAAQSRRRVPSVEAVGRASYGIFLHHQWILGVVTAALLRVGYRFVSATSLWGASVVGGVAFALAFAVGELSRRYVEEPFLRGASGPRA